MADKDPETSTPSRGGYQSLEAAVDIHAAPGPSPSHRRVTPPSDHSTDFPRVTSSASLESDHFIDIDTPTDDDPKLPHGNEVPPGSYESSPVAIRRRGTDRDTMSSEGGLDSSFQDARNLQYEIVVRPENEIEAHRMTNNYLFGFRKWKSHVTSRPLSVRSKVVKELYTDQLALRNQPASTITFGNVMYTILFGWWLALLYGIIGCLMFLTIIARNHGFFCFKLAAYFFWPFGKFIHKTTPKVEDCSSTLSSLAAGTSGSDTDAERSPLLASTEHIRLDRKQRADRTFSHGATGYWRRPSSYIWLVLGIPLLALAHVLVFLLAWLSVVCVPIAKINAKALRRILLLPPELCIIDNSHLSDNEPSSDILMYVHSAANLYYYKYTVDGMNIICVNLLVLVPLAIGFGYGDRASTYTTEQSKFVMALLAIIPLAYAIGMAITCISAQTSFALGAVINATFGSIVEIILYVSALVRNLSLAPGSKGSPTGNCYTELVKSGLAGTLLAMTMLVPGLAMVVGGLRHRTLRFNARSAGVGATLLFVCVAGVFAPSIFARSFSQLKCRPCVNNTMTSIIAPEQNVTEPCMDCQYDEPTPEFYKSSILPLVYICMVLLPTAYIVGLIFSLKTHRSHIYDTFTADVGGNAHGHGAVVWGKVKSIVVLLIGITLMSVCADLVTENIQPILNESGVSLYFIGVTLLALVPDIPEIVIGIQFALQNQMSLSIEVGSCIAVQVCMLQVPVLVLADLIYPMGFMLIFTDVHIWSVLLGVLMMNYIFQDGKSDYFQGSAMVFSYFILIAMYFFIPNPTNMTC